MDKISKTKEDEYQQELIVSKKEKLMDLHCIV